MYNTTSALAFIILASGLDLVNLLLRVHRFIRKTGPSPVPLVALLVYIPASLLSAQPIISLIGIGAAERILLVIALSLYHWICNFALQRTLGSRERGGDFN